VRLSAMVFIVISINEDEMNNDLIQKNYSIDNNAFCDLWLLHIPQT
jgi:hypothetical protein